MPRDMAGGVTLLCLTLDGERAVVDQGALHGESAIERGVRFSDDETAAPGGRTVSVVWIGIRAGVSGRDGYLSAVASALRIDSGRNEGVRPARHFTDMIEAINGSTRLDGLSATQIEAVGEALAAHDAVMWEERSEALHRIWPQRLTAP